MPQKSSSPEILAQARTAQGVAFQLRKDPMGVLDVPGLENVLISIHVGAPTKLACRRDGRRHTGTAVHGDIDIIPAHTPSRWEMHDENDMALLLSLPQSLLHAVANESGLDVTRLEIRNRFQIRDTELEALSWGMKREMELGHPSGRLYLDGLTLAVASRLVSRHSSDTKQTSERNEGLSGRRLKQVLSFIEDQLAEDLSLEQIAAVAGVSASHLATLFRISMGVPVHKYIIERRVERAKTLLLQNGRSMAEIALAAGFAHQSHMARHMRRVLGMPPRAIQRLLTEASSFSD
ncbi:MAG: AraC family transcriptional regulator [Edaphobacter sp.]|nr:AraC family transcriptional regulator [Edaphobacter sp.]